MNKQENAAFMAETIQVSRGFVQAKDDLIAALKEEIRSLKWVNEELTKAVNLSPNNNIDLADPEF